MTDMTDQLTPAQELTAQRLAEVQAWEDGLAAQAPTPAEESAMAERARNAGAWREQLAAAQAAADAPAAPDAFAVSSPAVALASLHQTPDPVEVSEDVVQLRAHNAERVAVAQGRLDAERATLARLQDEIASSESAHDQAKAALVTSKLDGIAASKGKPLLDAVIRAAAEVDALKAAAERQSALVDDMSQRIAADAESARLMEFDAQLATYQRQRTALLAQLVESSEAMAASLESLGRLDYTALAVSQQRARARGEMLRPEHFPTPRGTGPEAFAYSDPRDFVARLRASLGA